MPFYKRSTLEGHEFHDNASGEIAAVTEKTTPVSADLVLIEDSADSNAKKRVQLVNLPGSGGGGGAVALIEEVALTSDQTTIVFDNIPSFYNELRIELFGRSVRTGSPVDRPRIRFGNGTIDSGNNYDSSAHDSQAGATSQGAASSGQLSRFTIPAVTRANLYAAHTTTIPQYAGSKFKSYHTQGGFYDSSVIDAIRRGEAVGHWHSTAAVDIIHLFCENADWASGSVFRLYGVG